MVSPGLRVTVGERLASATRMEPVGPPTTLALVPPNNPRPVMTILPLTLFVNTLVCWSLTHVPDDGAVPLLFGLQPPNTCVARVYVDVEVSTIPVGALRSPVQDVALTQSVATRLFVPDGYCAGAEPKLMAHLVLLPVPVVCPTRSLVLDTEQSAAVGSLVFADDPLTNWIQYVGGAAEVPVRL